MAGKPDGGTTTRPVIVSLTNSFDSNVDNVTIAAGPPFNPNMVVSAVHTNTPPFSSSIVQVPRSDILATAFRAAVDGSEEERAQDTEALSIQRKTAFGKVSVEKDFVLVRNKKARRRSSSVDKNTSACMRFYMRPSSEKTKLRPLIEHGGGILVNKCLPNIIRLVEPGSKVLTSDSNTISTKYIWDCVKENRLLDKTKYHVKIRSVDVSDISDEEEPSRRLFVVKTTERNLKARRDYTHEDDKKIIDYIIKTKRYSEVRGVTLWRNLENTGLLDGRTSQSLRERWRRHIAPKLYAFNLTDNQVRSFTVEGGNINTERQRQSSGRQKSRSKKVKEVVEISDESDDASTDSKTADFSHKSKRCQNSYTDKEVWAIFRYIFSNFVQEDITSETMWVKMESLGITSHSWKSMKEHFFEQIVPNIHSYHLPKFEMKRLATVITLPNKDDSTRSSSPEDASNEGDKSVISACEVPAVNDRANVDTIGEKDTWAIFKYIFKNFIYEDITSDATWLNMEEENVTRHSWHAMKDHFFQYLIPNIHSYDIPKLQLRRLASMVSLPDLPENNASTSSACKENTATKKPNLELQDDCDSYTDEDSEAMLKYILEDLDRYELNDETLWKNMERRSVTPHSWKSMKFYFFQHIVPSIHRHNLPKEVLRRLRRLVRLPNPSASEKLRTDKSTSEVKSKPSTENPPEKTNCKDGLSKPATQSSPSNDIQNSTPERRSPRRSKITEQSQRKTPNKSGGETSLIDHDSLPKVQAQIPSKTPNKNTGETSLIDYDTLPKVQAQIPNCSATGTSATNDSTSPKGQTRIAQSRWSLRSSDISEESPQKTLNHSATGTSSTNDNSLPKGRTRIVEFSRSLRSSAISVESPQKLPNHNAPGTSSTNINSSPKGQTDVTLCRRSVRMSEITKGIGKEIPPIGSSENTGQTSPRKNTGQTSPRKNTGQISPRKKTSETCLPNSQSLPTLLGSRNASETSPSSQDRSSTQITSEVSEDEDNCTYGAEENLLPQAQLRLNSLRRSLVAKMGSNSPSTRSCSEMSVDTLDEQLLGNLRTPILQSMKKRIQSVLMPQVASEVAPVEDEGIADLPSRQDSNDVFKVPEAVVRSPRRKRDAAGDICTTTPKSRLTNQENHVPPPRNLSPRFENATRSTLGERNALGARDTPTEIQAGAENGSRCIRTNSILLMQTAKKDVSDLIDEVGEWFSTSDDSEDRVHVTKQKIQECYEKLEHLNEFMNRALLSARVERIMVKSPDYTSMSREEKLAIYQFVTFYKS